MKQYKIEIGDNESYIFRSISAEEADRFNQLLASENPFAEEFIFNIITDNKYNIDDLNAGIIIMAVYAAINLSGYFKDFHNIIDKIEEARTKYSNHLYNRMFYERIMRTIPGLYKIEDLRNKTLNELLELVILGENITGIEQFNIKEMREALLEDTDGSKKKKSKNKAINSITKDELEALKATLQASEHDGAPIDGI